MEYPCLQDNARQLLSWFGSTYNFESTFSYMARNNTSLVIQTIDANIEDQLKLRDTTLHPNIQ